MKNPLFPALCAGTFKIDKKNKDGSAAIRRRFTMFSIVKLLNVFFLFSMATGGAYAQIINVNFQTEIRIYDNGGFFGRAGIVNGDLIEGSFSYDTTTAPWSNVSSTFAQYDVIDYQYTIGGGKAIFEWLGGGSGIVVANNRVVTSDPNGWDYVELGMSGSLTNPLTNESISSDASNRISDYTGTLFSSTALPGFNALSELINPLTNPSYVPFYRDQRLPDYDTHGSNLVWTASVTTVPIPAAVYLFCSGLAGLGFASRKKKVA